MPPSPVNGSQLSDECPLPAFFLNCGHVTQSAVASLMYTPFIVKLVLFAIVNIAINLALNYANEVDRRQLFVSTGNV